MKKLLLPFFALLCFSSLAQNSGEKEKFDWLSHQNITSFAAGRYYVDFNALNTQLSLWGAKKTFPEYYYMVGTSGTVGELKRGHWDVATSLEFMIPQEVSVGSNDSLNLRMRGWHFMSSAFGKDVIPGKAVALVLAPGIDWGSTKIFRTLGGSHAKYKNPFVSPLLRADLRFMFGKFAFGGRAFYRYDITNSIWKRREDGMAVLPGTKMSGLGMQVFIGWQAKN